MSGLGERSQTRQLRLEQGIRDEHIVTGQHLGLAHFGDRDPDRAGIELHLRDLGDLVGLHVRPERDAPRATLRLHPRDVALQDVEIDVEGRGVEVECFHYRAFLAMHSISTAMPPGSAPAWIVVQAGNGAVKNVAYTSFIAAKSLISRKKTLHLTTCSSDEPAAWRIARRFSNTRLVSNRAFPSSSFPVSGLMHPCPETKMKSPSMTPCEYGPTGFGAFSVTMAFLKRSSSFVSRGNERGILPPQWPEHRPAKNCRPGSVPRR